MRLVCSRLWLDALTAANCVHNEVNSLLAGDIVAGGDHGSDLLSVDTVVFVCRKASLDWNAILLVVLNGVYFLIQISSLVYTLVIAIIDIGMFYLVFFCVCCLWLMQQLHTCFNYLLKVSFFVLFIICLKVSTLVFHLLPWGMWLEDWV